jgi:hypothetical protein
VWDHGRESFLPGNFMPHIFLENDRGQTRILRDGEKHQERIYGEIGYVTIFTHGGTFHKVKRVASS